MKIHSFLLLVSSFASAVAAFKDHPKYVKATQDDSKIIQGSYIVIMEEDAGPQSLESLPGFDAAYIKHQYKVLLNKGVALSGVPGNYESIGKDRTAMMAD